jgi:ankyrin repeat protein
MRAAIKAGDAGAVRKLMAGPRFSVEEMLGLAVTNYSTAPKHAGHGRIIDLLVARGAVPRWHLIFEAARGGSDIVVERLLAGGMERNIFVAAAMGDAKRVAAWLRKEPELARSRGETEVRSHNRLTPLHFCAVSAMCRGGSAERAFLETAKLLLEHGAEVNAEGVFYGYAAVTPLELAAHTGGNLALAEFLIDAGARISMFAFGEALGHRGRSLEDGLSMGELFLRRGFSIREEHVDGTILHRAANTGGAACVRWLLERGADVNARGRQGRTPLHLAAERNTSARVAEVLVAHGARVDARDDSGMTPLDVAREHGRTAVARWLGDHGG